MTYTRLRRQQVTRWAKTLIHAKGSTQQLSLLHAIRENDHQAFASFIEASLTAGGGESAYEDGEPPPSLAGLDIQLQPGHMYLMPAADIARLYSHWQHIPYELAADFTLWGAITLTEIREERVRPVWLVVNNRCDEEFARRELDSAIGSGASNPKAVDTLVRRALRWMTGPGTMRGAVELYGNCSLAKAWWCGYFSAQCAEILKSEPDIAQHASPAQVTEALKSVWLELADYLSGKLTVLAEGNVLSGIALWAVKANEESSVAGRNVLTRVDVKNALLELGEMASWRALAVCSPQDICSHMQQSQQATDSEKPGS